MAPLFHTMFRSSRSRIHDISLSLTTIDRSSHNCASLNENKETTYKQEEEDKEKKNQTGPNPISRILDIQIAHIVADLSTPSNR